LFCSQSRTSSELSKIDSSSDLNSLSSGLSQAFVMFGKAELKSSEALQHQIGFQIVLLWSFVQTPCHKCLLYCFVPLVGLLQTDNRLDFKRN
jgi:hypothetical protein